MHLLLNTHYKMISVKQKLFYSTYFFKIFGLELEKFEELTSKRLKLLQYWPFLIFSIHLVVICKLTLETFWSLVCNDYNFRSDYAGILLLTSLSTSSAVGVIFTFSQRNVDKKFWRLLDELDDIILKFLDIKLNYHKENRNHILRIFILLTLILSLAASIRVTKFSSSEKFTRYYGSSFYLAVLNQLNLNKFIFYASIIKNRLAILGDNFYQIKHHDYKLRTVPHVYSILWLSLKALSTRFAYPLICQTVNVLIMIMFFGFLLANMLLLDWVNFFHVFSLAIPQTILWVICIVCHKINKMVS